MSALTAPPTCPCDSGLPFGACCADLRRATTRLDEQRLAAWAEARGVLDQLAVVGGSASGATREAAVGCPTWMRTNLTIGELLAPVVGLLRHDGAGPLRVAAWSFLAGEVAAVAEGIRAEADAGPRPGPTDPTLAILAQRLAALRAELRRQVAPRALDRLPSHALIVEAGSRRLHYLERRRQRTASQAIGDPSVILPVAGALEAPLPPPSCTCQARRPCTHALAALDVALEQLGRPEPGPLWTAMAREVELSDWQRALAELGAIAPPRSPAAGGVPALRLSFRVADWRVGNVHVVPYREQRRKDGSHGAPRRLTARELERAEGGLAEEDQAVLRQLGLNTRTFYAFSYGGSGLGVGGRAVEALVGHPRVFPSNGEGPPLTVERAGVVLSVRPAPEGGLEVTAVAGGSPVPLPQLRRCLEGLGAEQTFTWVDEDRRRVLVIRPEAPEVLAKIAAALERRGQRFPPQAESALLERLGALQALVPLELDPALAGEEVLAGPGLVVRLALREVGLSLQVLAQPLPEAQAYPPGEGPPRLVASTPAGRRSCQRAPEQETSAARALLSGLPLEGAAEHPGFRVSVPDDARALAVLEALQRLGREEVTVEWTGPAPRLARASGVQGLRVAVRDRGDWFGLDGHVEVDGERVQLALLLEALRERRSVVRLEGGAWLAISAELAERLAPLAQLSVSSGRDLEVGPSALGLLDDLARDGATLDAYGAFASLRERMQAASRRNPRVPAAFKGKLRPYQVEGFRWLARLAAWGAGGVLADDMGLGKTLQALALLCHRAAEGPALVVAPTSVCANWAAEARRFAPSLRVTLFRDSERAEALATLGPGDVLVASYGLLALDLDRLKALRFATLVLDEAQAVKNAATRRARAARELQAGFRVALSGTPVENHLGELWSLYRIVFPGLLGSWELYRARFALPIERDQDEGRRRALAATLRPFLLRRTKSEVAPELPIREDITLPIVLPPEERANYEQARLAAVARLAGLGERVRPEQRRFQVLAAITQLRRLACHPRLHEPGSRLESAKLARFMDLVGGLCQGGHRTLVFSQFTSHLALVRQALDAAGHSHLYLDGQTPARQRDELVQRFQGGEGQLFLISLKAGGTGLNLTAADYVVHLDPWWNPAVEDQASDRAHRIGQRRPVTVYRLVAQGTIEEAILGLHGRKRALVAGVLDGMAAAGALSADELMALVRAGESGAAGAPGFPSAVEATAADLEETSAPDPRAAEEVAGWGPDAGPVNGARPGGGPSSSAGLAEAGYAALLDRFERQLEADHRRGAVRQRGTVRSYPRAVGRFLAWLDREGVGPARLLADPEALADAYVDGLRRCEIPGPRSEPGLARSAIGRFRRMLDGG